MSKVVFFCGGKCAQNKGRAGTVQSINTSNPLRCSLAKYFVDYFFNKRHQSLGNPCVIMSVSVINFNPLVKVVLKSFKKVFTYCICALSAILTLYQQKQNKYYCELIIMHVPNSANWYWSELCKVEIKAIMWMLWVTEICGSWMNNRTSSILRK